jgi:hypothetical protein
MSAAIADISNTAAPSSRTSSERRARGQTIGTPNAVPYSDGIVHVIVNGVPIVRAGAFDETGLLQGQRFVLGSRMPGRPIRAPRVTP